MNGLADQLIDCSTMSTEHRFLLDLKILKKIKMAQSLNKKPNKLSFPVLEISCVTYSLRGQEDGKSFSELY
jgi:hypothetical protein